MHDWDIGYLGGQGGRSAGYIVQKDTNEKHEQRETVIFPEEVQL
jgi:hypothetical protein